MTLGPALIVLALTDRIDGKGMGQRVCIIFGRVPMFYYLLQFPLAHALAIILSYLAGKDVAYLFLNFPASFASAPPDAGFPVLGRLCCMDRWLIYPVSIVPEVGKSQTQKQTLGVNLSLIVFS